MKNTPRTYVLTLNSPSRKGLRLWMGKSIHALRHCSAKQISFALREMQQNVDSLYAPVSSSGGSYALNRIDNLKYSSESVETEGLKKAKSLPVSS